MKTLSSFAFFWLTTFGKPACDREVYKLIRKNKIQSMVEFGLGLGTRAETMIQVAQKYSVSETIRYTGIDLFESRESDRQVLLFKEMHKRLNGSGAKIQLVPGNPSSALSRIANTTLRTDLILISADFSEKEFQDSWFFMPRMLHAKSFVLIQHQADGPYQILNRLDIEKRSNQSRSAAAAA